VLVTGAVVVVPTFVVVVSTVVVVLTVVVVGGSVVVVVVVVVIVDPVDVVAVVVGVVVVGSVSVSVVVGLSSEFEPSSTAALAAKPNGPSAKKQSVSPTIRSRRIGYGHHTIRTETATAPSAAAPRPVKPPRHSLSTIESVRLRRALGGIAATARHAMAKPSNATRNGKECERGLGMTEATGAPELRIAGMW
jgi:hypothetical protein